MTDASRTAVVVPTIGESITTAYIAGWAKQVGEVVTAGQTLFTVDSDKASLEVPSPVSGVLAEIVSADGDEVAIGAVVAWVTEGAADAPAATAAPEAAAKDAT